MNFMLQSLIPTLFTLLHLIELAVKRAEADGLVVYEDQRVGEAYRVLYTLCNEVDYDLWSSIEYWEIEDSRYYEDSLYYDLENASSDEERDEMRAAHEAHWGQLPSTRRMVEAFIEGLAKKHGDIVKVGVKGAVQDAAPLRVTMAEMLDSRGESLH